MAAHGDITEVTYNHPTIGSGVFYPKANEGNKFDPGGIRNNDDASSIAGDGQLIVQKNRVVGFFEVLVENDGRNKGSALDLVKLTADPVAADWTFSLINGQVYSCNGIHVGDIQPDVNAGTFSLKVVTGNMKKII